MIGTRLGHYKILDLLGAGGMGEVYRARDGKLEREVAIKVLPEALAADPERLARLEREAKVLASLNHPQVAGIYSLEEEDDLRFLVLELVEGNTLADRLESGSLEVEEALDIAHQIAEALEVAHESGIIHRDLKPANVKVTPEGRVKVLDFGLAKTYERVAPGSGSSPEISQSPTMAALTGTTSMILGTAAYMSPEQARGKVLDKRTDIFSFGCVLYEMLTGKRPFSGSDVSVTLASVIKDTPDWDALPVLPAPVARLLRRCLRKDPKSRLRDIGDARVVIEDVLAGVEDEELAGAAGPGHADSPGSEDSSDGSGNPRSARKRVAMAIGIVVVAIIAAIVGRNLAPDAAPIPLRKFDIIVEDLAVNFDQPPVISPDGARIAYVVQGTIWIRDLDRLEPRELTGTSGASNTFWSPDGAHLAYSADEKLWRIPVEGGDPLTICDLPETGSIVGGAWSSEGRIAFAAWRGALYEVSAGGGAPTLILPIDVGNEIDFHSPSYLPDGRSLLMSPHFTNDVDGTIEVLRGTERTVVLRLGSNAHTPVYSPTGHLLYSLTDGGIGIWAVRFDPLRAATLGEPFRINSSPAVLSMAGDGTLVSARMWQDSVRELVWVDREGQDVGTIDRPRLNLRSPALSPDGMHVAVLFEENDEVDIWSLETAGGGVSRLTFDPGMEAGLTWSPRGDKVYFTQRAGAEANEFGQVLASIRADGRGSKRVHVTGENPAFTSDGEFVVYTVDDRGQRSLWMARVEDDGNLVDPQPLRDDESHSSPAAQDSRSNEDGQMGVVSPDGRFLAYTSTSTGQPEVHLRRFPEGGGHWQVSFDGGREARWAADTGELFFIAGTGSSGRRLVAVDVGEGSSPTITEPLTLFHLESEVNPYGFSVAPDGERFLMVRIAEVGVQGSSALAAGGLARITLVQNWYEEFREQR